MRRPVEVRPALFGDEREVRLVEEVERLGDQIDGRAPAERDALRERVARLEAAYRLEAMRRENYTHADFDAHIASLQKDTPNG